MPVSVTIPLDAPPELGGNMPEKFPCLYLLHGYGGCQTDWLFGAPIRELSLKYKLAMVMPAIENSFYLNDDKRCAMYEDYITKELPEFICKVFPVSDKVKDTAIAGLSMGGFGALHSGLAAPETFGNIIALSSALITDEVANMKDGQGNQIAPYSYYVHTFGEPPSLLGSHNDPKALAKQLSEKNRLPGIYMACGTEDFLIDKNRNFHEYLESLGVEHVYVEGSGVHDWKFWSEYIQKALEWLAPRMCLRGDPNEEK